MQKARYTYDAVGNITSIANTPDWTAQSSNVRVADTVQTFQYDDLYQLKQATGTTRSEQNNQDRYSLAVQYDALGNLTLKDQVSYRQAFTNGAWRDEYPTFGKMYKAKYFYDGTQPHTPSQIIEAIPNENVNIGQGEYDFERDFDYDGSGNQTQSIYRGSDRRNLEWNEDNQLKRVVKNSQELNLTLYDAQGQKAVHLHRVVGLEETAYLGPHLTLRDGRYLTKHVFSGSERLSSKMDPDWFNEPPVIQFHSDHLGSTNYTTNNDQFLIQHDEYYPSGELWTDQTDSRYELARRFVFAGKEQDVHTGLIDFGARSYDARQGQWLSPDPALPEYLRGERGPIHRSSVLESIAQQREVDAEQRRKLPSLDASIRHLAAFDAVVSLPDHERAGVYNPASLSAYSYAQNNLVAVQDPDGEAAQVLTACFFGPIACSGAVVLLAVISVGVLTNMKGDSVVKAEEAKPDVAPAPAATGDAADAPPSVGFPGNDPSKAPEGFEWRGRPGSKPGAKDGNFHNPKTGESLRPDLDHPAPVGPHWDYKDASGKWWRIRPDGSAEPK